jgi:hypothetical protein
VRPSLAHLLVLSASQDVKFEFLAKSRVDVDQVKEAMTYSMKLENKLDGVWFREMMQLMTLIVYTTMLMLPGEWYVCAQDHYL